MQIICSKHVEQILSVINITSDIKLAKHVEQILSVINITSDIKLVSNSSTICLVFII